MGWASEMAIEIHNEQMVTDPEYAEEYFRADAEYRAWFEWRVEVNENEIDWFPDYRLDYTGYEERTA